MNLPERKPTRLKGYDYSTPGAYFITICTHNKKHLFGDIVGAIHELPENKLSQYGEYVEEIITQVINNKRSSKLDFLDNLAKSLACKRSIKGNEFVSKLQIEYLLEDLVKCHNPYTCPHGRPIIIKYSKYEIEKWFKRVQ